MSSIIKMPQLDVTRLAADYSAAIRAAHSELELRAIRDRNAIETDAAVDHVHDYTDANDLMSAAVTLQLGAGWNWNDLADDINIATDRAKAAEFRLSRVLIACEFSGRVRDAMTACGHSAISCDLLPTETPGQHYQGDVRDILGDGYHLMIAHPDCTFLCNSGVKHLVRGGQRIDPERWTKMHDAAEFFRDLEAAPIERIARENPIMHKYAREIVGRGADQYIQPNEYGDDASKKTGLWLKNLAKLVADPADYVEPRMVTYRGKLMKRWANQSPCGADSRGPSPTRGHDRSRTYPGFAKAMAEQWGGIRRLVTESLTPPQEALQLALF